MKNFIKKYCCLQKGSVISGSLLIAGTSIGAGMLALPLVTSYGGFFPALAIFAVCWASMVATGLLILEIAMGMKKGSNIISMAGDTLGTTGKVISWTLYLFLFYSLNIAYISGGGSFILDVFAGGAISVFGPLLFVTVFGMIVYFGARVVGRINIMVMTTLVVTYFAFVALGWRYVDTANLTNINWSASLVAMPVVLTSFGFQGVVPTLISYMDHDVKKIRRAIIIGATIPFVIYAIWEWLVLGIVPLEGPEGMRSMMEAGGNVLQPLKNVIGDTNINVIHIIFAFCALLSSFFGVSLGVIDFLADGLTIKKSFKGKILLSALAFVPPLIITMTYPHIFLVALRLGGGLGSALLLGLLPVMITWVRRYRMNDTTSYTFPGGRAALIAIAVVAVMAVAIQIAYFV
ncbi:MAG: tyrosine transporter [Waddliaceae bacterium]|jgi:tyrosine-specific transport protein|nr:tyrosine transporter [Waddliaceae bacterium]MBT3578418.1 tyrosine transporter [Waddliaceae bacterium]MBT4445270.1 tyrosine transporter [Waddliaceae bacterium]MBT6929132.1 tyrosine transporter [Waddliaceae bacterium]MBT7264631.1 tyrosine transporter [Waddliaceae bacterium]